MQIFFRVRADDKILRRGGVAAPVAADVDDQVFSIADFLKKGGDSLPVGGAVVVMEAWDFHVGGAVIQNVGFQKGFRFGGRCLFPSNGVN